MSTIVIGGGVGGLSAAIALAMRGESVTLCEARHTLGGLAQALDVDGVRFDGGPYILLDPTGLIFALERLGVSVEALQLGAVEDVYEVDQPDRAPVRVRSSLEATVDGLEKAHPGQGVAYRAFVHQMTEVHRALEPLQRDGRPSPLALLRTGAMGHAPFLLRGLRRVFDRAGLNATVRNAIGIWTHVAGQSLDSAPSPLALVPAMIHGPGCFVPRGGVAAIVDAVVARAREVGVTLRTDARVKRITTANSAVTGVELETGERLESTRVVSDANGVSTLVELTDVKSSLRRRAEQLPLQSPGVAAYVLAASPPGKNEPYLRFRVTDDAVAPCRLIVRPDALSWRMEQSAAGSNGSPMRVVAPLSHDVAQRLNEPGQQALLDGMLAEPWVREHLGPHREHARLVPASWGRRHVLYRDSMNPVMTAKFMRQGRLPHRVGTPEGLFLVGSSTHPGQWVSFCLISGLLGAEEALGA